MVPDRGDQGLVTDPSGEKEEGRKFVAARIAERLHLPGYAQVRKVALLTERWSVDNGLLTATLKPKRGVILERYKDRLADLYKGHGG
jgi:long-chain acyl-CoA synthetase